MKLEVRTRLAKAPRELAALARAISLVLVALAVVLLCDSLGGLASFDDGLRWRYVELAEALGESRATRDRVVVVVADRETVAEWGPPPYSAEQLTALVEPIEAGDPDLIAELGFTRMLGGEELGELQRDGLLLRSGDSQLASPWSGPGLVHGDLLLGPSDVLVELGERSATLPPMPSRLPVRWLTPRSRLPVVSAHDVASGRIPAGTFAGRVVVLGVSDPNHAMPIATPLGLLSPVEIEAHALAGLADDALWREPPPAAIYLGCLVLALALLWSSSRVRGLRFGLLLVGGCALLLLGDFVAYTNGWLRLGSAHALATGVAVLFGHWALILAQASRAVEQLSARVLQAMAGSDAARVVDDTGFWDDLAALGSEFARAHLADAATTMLERQHEGWSLHTRASAGADEQGLEVPALGASLDLRRAPFRGVWLTQRASWIKLDPRSPVSTLIVPLEHEGEFLGLWLVHTGERDALEPEVREGFEALGAQIAASLVRRRQRSALREQAAATDLRGRVDTIIGGLELVHNQRRWGIELLEQLPVRAAIATAWGEFEFVDPRLRAELGQQFPHTLADEDPAHGLQNAIVRLSGVTFEQAHRMMREVIQRGVEVELPASADDEPEVWVLSRIYSERGIGLPGFRPAVHEHILLSARPSAAREAAASGKRRVLRSA